LKISSTTPVSYREDAGGCGISGQIMKVGRMHSSVAVPGTKSQQTPIEKQLECQKVKRCEK
jgi:hypothetical protein